MAANSGRATAASLVRTSSKTSGGVDLTSRNADGSGGYQLAWVQPGEWLNYTVAVAATGTYTLGMALASQGAGGTFHFTLDGVAVSGTFTVPNTGGWYTWQTLTGPALSLPVGRHTLRLVCDTVGSSGFVGNFAWFSLDGTNASHYLPLVRQG